MGRFQLTVKPGDRSDFCWPVENVVITTKGLQDRNTYIRWKDSGKKGKLILNEINTWIGTNEVKL